MTSQNNPVDGEKLPEDRDEQINQVASDVLAVVSPEGHDTEEWTQVRDAVAKNFPSAVPAPSALKKAEGTPPSQDAVGGTPRVDACLNATVRDREHEMENIYALARTLERELNEAHRHITGAIAMNEIAASQLAAATRQNEEMKGEQESEKFKRADFAQKFLAEMDTTDALRKEIEEVKAQWRMSSVCREKDAQLTAALSLVAEMREALKAADSALSGILCPLDEEEQSQPVYARCLKASSLIERALTLPADQPKQEGERK